MVRGCYCFAPGASYSSIFFFELLDEWYKIDRSLSLPHSASSSSIVYVCHGEGRSALRRWESADLPPTVKDYYYFFINLIIVIADLPPTVKDQTWQPGSFGLGWCLNARSSAMKGSSPFCSCALTNILSACLPDFPASAAILILVSPKSVIFAPDWPTPKSS